MKQVKALPCRHCKDVAKLPDGKPYFMMGTGDSTRPFLYRCSKCKRKSEITASEFAFLKPYKENS